MPESNLNPCPDPGLIHDLNIDPAPPYCREQKAEGSSGTIDHKPYPESQKETSSDDLSWLEDATQNKLGNGAANLCDPQQTGHIVNDQGMESPNRDVVYRYSRSIRGTDEAMRDLFRDIVVEDEAGKIHAVPIMWATQEKAVTWILQENTRKDESLVVDRIRLPTMAIYAANHSFADNRYIYHKAINYLRDWKDGGRPRFTTSERFERDTVFGVSRGIPLDIEYSLVAWTMYEEDMNQIVEQVVTKFSRMAYIRVKGIAWEIGVKLNSIRYNAELEPGDKKDRGVFKYEFSFTAETFVAQPVVRKKAVLKTRVEIVDTPEEDNIAEVLARLEQAVKEVND
jgi:hypothetical protein